MGAPNRTSPKYCVKIEGRNLVPFSGVIVGKGKEELGTSLVSHLTSFAEIRIACSNKKCSRHKM